MGTASVWARASVVVAGTVVGWAGTSDAQAHAPAADTTAVVTGVVRSQAGTILPYAGITASALRLIVASNAAGRYELRLPSGEYKLRVRRIGYHPIDTVVTVKAGRTYERDFTLRTQPLSLDGDSPERRATVDSLNRIAAEKNSRTGATDSAAMGLFTTDSAGLELWERLGIALLRSAVAEGGAGANRVLSPVGIGQALSLSLAAARDSTSIQLGLGLRVRDTSVASLGVSTRRYMAQATKRTELALSMANALWVDHQWKLVPAFQERSQREFAASVRSVALHEPSIVPILNRWADSATRGVIKEVRKKEFDTTIVVVLTNAVYFKADWAVKFDSVNTQPRSFRTGTGRRSTLPTMARVGDLVYRRDSLYATVRLPYKGGTTALYVVLPDSGVAATTVLDAFARRGWPLPDPRAGSGQVDVRLPRVKVREELDLIPPMKDVGMAIVFDTGRADFGRLVIIPPSLPPLCPPISIGPFFGKCSRVLIKEAKHHTGLDINESGTEAAAVTVISFGIVTVGVSEPPRFYVDRPFFIALRDERTGVFLFMGYIADPSK